MFGMPQKLLKQKFLFIVLLIFLFGGKSVAAVFKYKFSLEKGSDSTNLNQPFDVFFDFDSKRIYVADTGNDRLVSFSLDGKPLKQFNAAGKLRWPIALVRDKKFRLWVIERSMNSLTFIDLKKHIFKRYYLKLNNNPVIPDRLLLWNGFLILLDRFSGKALLIDKKDMKIVKVLSPKAKKFKGFIDIKLKEDNLFGLEYKTGKIFEINLKNGKERNLQLQASMVLPISFEIDSQGNFYVLDRDLKMIFVFDKKGHLQYKFLKEGFHQGQVRYPWKILMIGSKLFVIDEGNGRVDVWGH